ncbi:MAG: nucleoside hydrolase [Promethearchaeota archaeon]
MVGKKMPIILDTDIGYDIDDTWALAFILSSEELDLKLVSIGTHDTPSMAKIAAKFLEISGNSNIPIAIGPKQDERVVPQIKWAEGYDLGDYPGEIYSDGIQEIINIIMDSHEPVTVVSIGPTTNIALALNKEPGIVHNSRFVGMQGSIYRGYNGSKRVSREYNVAQDPASCRRVFTAGWDVTITPLDTCGLVVLDGARYKRVFSSEKPMLKALIENYKIWSSSTDYKFKSSTLFDTVAVYLAFSEELLMMEDLSITVTREGKTKVSKKGKKKIRCAVQWRDLEGFKDLLVDRLCR